MDKLPVGQLPDISQSSLDDEIMIITEADTSQLRKEKISNILTDIISVQENNALTKGTDGKMFVTDFGNASNITEGTLPVDVLPESGVTADTYAYPSSVTVNAQGQVTAIEEGTPSGANANIDLSNITEAGKEVIRQNSDDVGDPIITLSNTLGENEIWLEGAEVSRETYAQLFEIYGTTYGEGDGSITFNLPDFRNRTLWGSNQFGYIEAGLPNITGAISNILMNANAIGSGCHRIENYGNAVQGSSAYGHIYTMFTDLSRVNSIYKNDCNTVQPPSIQVRVKTRYQ